MDQVNYYDARNREGPLSNTLDNIRTCMASPTVSSDQPWWRPSMHRRALHFVYSTSGSTRQISESCTRPPPVPTQFLDLTRTGLSQAPWQHKPAPQPLLRLPTGHLLDEFYWIYTLAALKYPREWAKGRGSEDRIETGKNRTRESR